MDRFIVNILSKTRIVRCYYYTMKQTMEWHGTRRAQLYYYVDILLFLYVNVRLLSMVYLIDNQYKYDVRLPYNFKRDDPFLSYLYQNKHKYGKEVPIIFLIMGLFNFICQDALYRLNVNTLTWRWWYQLIVINQDDYYRFHVKNFRMITIAKSVQIAKHMSTHPLWSFLPSFIINFIAKQLSRIMVHYNLEIVEKNQFYNRKLSILPNLSFRLRSILINTLIMWDRLCCFLQLGLGMYKLKFNIKVL